MSMLFYHDEWSVRKLGDRYSRIMWSDCWAYQHTKTRGRDQRVDDICCWLVISRHPDALTSDDNATALQQLLAPEYEDTELQTQLFGPHDAIPTDWPAWRDGSWADDERTGVVNDMGLWSIKPDTLAVMPTEPPKLCIRYQQWPGLGAQEGTFHIHGASKKGTAANALTGFVEGRTKLLKPRK